MMASSKLQSAYYYLFTFVNCTFSFIRERRPVGQVAHAVGSLMCTGLRVQAGCAIQLRRDLT